MRKIINLFLVITVICINFVGFIGTVNAEESSTTIYGDDVINRIDDSESSIMNIITKLTDWSNSYASVLEDLISKDLLDDLSIDDVISKLNQLRHTQAANDLESIKLSINNDIDYLKTTFEMIENYLNNIPSDDNKDEIDIYYKVRSTFRNVKGSIKDLVNIYYDLYYDEIKDKIDTFNEYSDLEDLYNDISDNIFGVNALLDKIESKANRIKDIYVSKSLDDYDYVIKDEFRSYYDTFKNDYRTLYNKLELKLQTILDDKIDNVISGVDRTNVRQVIDANKELYKIIEKIDWYKTDLSSKFNRINSMVNGVNIIADYSIEYEDEILTRIQTASDYTRSKLIDLDLLVSVKNEIDKKYIRVDNENGIIIYDSKDLSPATLINRLLSNYGDLKAINTYNDKVGTLSKVQVYYENDVLKNFTLVVRGDINPNGRIDITDLVDLCDKIYGLKDLDTYEMLAADFDDNEKIDITDLVNLCDKIYE